MNAQQIARIDQPTTIGELKKYIADMEAAWTQEDTQYLGEFDNQGLYIDTKKGIDRAYIGYVGEFGFIAFQK